MKLFDGLQLSTENEEIKCPQCGSHVLESSEHIQVSEWKPGHHDEVSDAELESTYICKSCGHHFTQKDLINRKTFKQGMVTLFFIFIMIVLLLIVLL